ncbi:NAD(P)-binding Rossmann-fold superfamily protein [Actinidia rufa]|uniref:NAD(P)-binding Rossmann-fold superfamily protein n=1 Tax=Actinidia rufa TaxID=165716 RepID=A0A7J0ECH2_9ERIC|nr:NAD(P)-binding Rossmann-fold superfamily protein [Actinidia rufa]
MWLFGRKGASGFSYSSTAEEVTQGIDGSGLTAIVTGASSGIGTETARVLALRGAHVIMGVRNMAAGKEVKEAIVKEIPAAKIDAMELDLSSMASVRKFAAVFSSSHLPLNLLIAGHFLLTSLLLDTMKKTSRKTKKEGRIVNVSSEAHRFPYREGIRFDKINDQAGYSSLAAYGQSKLANVLHANELARRLKVSVILMNWNEIDDLVMDEEMVNGLFF